MGDKASARHIIDWQNPDYFDAEKLDLEMRRVFDVCHGCRACNRLCDSFPRLFELIDNSSDETLEPVPSSAFKKVVDACTLCDMCYMSTCPYTPPHEWAIDFPHLMLRYRAVEHKAGGAPTKASARLTETDTNGKIAQMLAPVMNWASDRRNGLTRPALEKLGGVHRDAPLPRYKTPTLVKRAKKLKPLINDQATAKGRKAVIFATCFANYNRPEIGEAALAVLAKNGIAAEVVYPQCCGMPHLEQGDLARVAESARSVSQALAPYVDKGYDVVTLVPSCALMLKSEWPLLLPHDPAVKALAARTFDMPEYIIDIARKEKLAEGLKPLEGGITLHLACHARAQNIGRKAADMLQLIPEIKLDVIERCSGHGGSLGIAVDFHETALKVGRPVARAALEKANRFVASECPLAATHIVNGMEKLAGSNAPDQSRPADRRAFHPIELFAKAYGLIP
ncbi:MAG: glycerol-3-phosphate dehydrogenase [Alphaproteobacteria bacterium]|nr:glycerol-3-phosphate dehydrogenase [Alphaproteobacteria bacterium]